MGGPEALFAGRGPVVGRGMHRVHEGVDGGCERGHGVFVAGLEVCEGDAGDDWESRVC